MSNEYVDKFRSKYRPLTETEQRLIENVKQAAFRLDILLNDLPPSREKSLAMTNLEQAVMWATKALTS